MKSNKLPILKISNIDWDKDHDDYEKLPKEVELKWDSEKWNIDDVANWLSLKFDWIFNSINIDQIGTWENSAGCSCCSGGCSCC